MRINILAVLAIGILIIFSTATANAASIDFENLTSGDIVNAQYSDLGIAFSDGPYTISTDPDDPLNNVLIPTDYSTGVKILFNTPVYSFYAYVYEIAPPEPEPEPEPEEEPEPEPNPEPEPEPEPEEEPEESVYLNIFGDDGSQLNSEDIVVHSTGIWSQIGYSNSALISYITLTGTKDFVIDDIDTNTTPVPEPATLFLIGTGIAGLAGMRFRKKKK